SVGRRQRCQAVPRLRGDDDSGGLLIGVRAARLHRPKPQASRLWLRYSEPTMIRIPVLRWGEPYTSLDIDKVVHFATGEVMPEVSQANGALVSRDMRFAQRARDVLREIPIKDILKIAKKAGDLYATAELPLGDGTQTPDQFVKMQSATTGLPE